MVRIKTSCIGLLLITLMIIVGCGSSESEEQALVGNELNPTSVEYVVEKDEQKVFAIVYPIAHPFFEATTRGAKDVAMKNGHQLLVLEPDDFDVKKQIDIMEDLINRQVDGIGIGATDAIALKPTIDQAIASGINVVTFDTDSPLSNRLAFIGTDNQLQGQDTGKVVAKLLEGEGKVLVSMGVPSQLNLRLRLEGLMEELSKYPNIEIIDIQSGNGDSERTSTNITEMILKYPDFDLLVGIDAQAGPSAVPIWEEYNLTQYLVVPEDMDVTIQGVKDGVVTACIAQEQYEWGKLVVELLNEASEGGTILAKYSTGTVEINIDNVHEKYPD